jgi:hypothetical protein
VFTDAVGETDLAACEHPGQTLREAIWFATHDERIMVLHGFWLLWTPDVREFQCYSRVLQELATSHLNINRDHVLMIDNDLVCCYGGGWTVRGSG